VTTPLDHQPDQDLAADDHTAHARNPRRRARVVVLLVVLATTIAVLTLTGSGPARNLSFCGYAHNATADTGAMASAMTNWQRAVTLEGQIDDTTLITDMQSLTTDYRGMVVTAPSPMLRATMHSLVTALVRFEALVDKTTNDSNAKAFSALQADLAQSQSLSSATDEMVSSSAAAQLSRICPGI
jgi:hypothetical protein